MWELDCEESWAVKNWCFLTAVLEKILGSLLDCKEIQPVPPKRNQSWVFFERNNAKAKTPILWPPHAKSWLIGEDWCWEGLGAGGEGDNRGWDGWMASPTRWTWVWVNCGRWWWTGRPGVLRFMGSQRVGHARVTELNWTELLMRPQLCLILYLATLWGNRYSWSTLLHLCYIHNLELNCINLFKFSEVLEQSLGTMICF